MKPQDKLLPQKLETGRWKERIMAYWSRDTRVEKSARTSAGIGKPKQRTDNCCKLDTDKSEWLKTLEGLSLQGTRHFCEFYIQKFHHVLTVNTGEKSPYAAGRWRGNVTILENNKSFCSSLKNLPSGETILLEPNMLRFNQSLTNLGKGSTKFQLPVPILSHLSREKTRKHWRSSHSQQRLNPRIATDPDVTKGLLTTVPFTQYIMSTTTKN